MLERHCRFVGQKTVVDLGSGLTPFPAILRHLGLKVHVVSMFDWLRDGAVESYTQELVDSILGYFDKIGIVVHQFDVTDKKYNFDDNAFDAVTCFHVIEHFHNTPKSTFSESYRILKADGVFVSAVPNAVNLRKRLSVISGRTNHYNFDEYYNSEFYYGHVREPTLSEFKQYYLRSGFEIREICGRNFIGLGGYLKSTSASKRGFGRVIQGAVVPLLELRPALCSDLHIAGLKPSA